VVRGYPDWFRRREIPAVTTLVQAEGVSVAPNSSAILVDVQGRGALTGLSVSAQGWSSLANCWLYVTVDGALRKLAFTGIAAPVVNSGAPYNSITTPFTVLNIDTANKRAGVSLSVPIRFSKSLKVEYRNEADTAQHTVSYILSLDLEQ